MPWISVRASLDRLKAEALAELDAEDLVRADDYCHSRPYFRSAENKKPVLCAVHVVGIGDPYRKRLESVQAIHRKLEDWNVRLQSDEPGYPLVSSNVWQPRPLQPPRALQHRA